MEVQEPKQAEKKDEAKEEEPEDPLEKKILQLLIDDNDKLTNEEKDEIIKQAASYESGKLARMKHDGMSLP